jgi:L-seryl-tRNA(Ser) seleniumtransferase
VLSGEPAPECEELVEEALAEIRRGLSLATRPALNATGVVLHTGLGRAVLAQAAVDNLVRVASGHCTLEIDEETGRRGSRLSGVSEMLRALVGCEDAVIVNNNAAAVLISIRNLAIGREVILSRGELVEIGGQFRIPDVIAAAGARLVEVGTTNKTRLSDFKKSIGADTALLLQVHPSNFRIVGFTAAVALSEMVSLAHDSDLSSMIDLGSGAMMDLSACGVPAEPTIAEVLASGVDVCTCSGDKLLGGPQCGIILGRREPLERIKNDPLMRALRVDKLTLAALEATLALYRDPDAAIRNIPALRAIARSTSEIRCAANSLADRLQHRLAGHADVGVVDCVSQVGGGALPAESLASAAVSLAPCNMGVEALARRLRAGTPAVYPRVARDRVLLDMRTVLPGEEESLFEVVIAALETGPGAHDEAAQ